MARFNFARIAAVAALALGASGIHAGTGTLTVNANITSGCKFTATPAMNFSIDPSAAGPATATSAVKYKCTKNTVAGTFDVGGTTNGTTGYSASLAGTGANTDTLAYTITWSAPGAFTGAGFGASAAEGTVNLTGSNAATQYQNATPDTYSGTVTLQILP